MTALEPPARYDDHENADNGYDYGGLGENENLESALTLHIDTLSLNLVVVVILIKIVKIIIIISFAQVLYVVWRWLMMMRGIPNDPAVKANDD